MFRYKLVTQDYKTRTGEDNETLWKIGKKITATGSQTKLCTDGLIHSYQSPLLAILMNPRHADIKNPKLILIQCTKILAKDSFKAGHKSATMVTELDLPEVSTIHKVAFSILCAKEVYSELLWTEWANKWLSGEGRTHEAATYAATYAAAAYAAYDAAYDAAHAAYDAATYAAAYAAHDAATYAAVAAAYAAHDAAHDAAVAAAYATYAAAYDAAGLNFLALAHKAMKVK